MSLAFTALASAARDAGDSELAAQYCNQAIERGVSGPEIYNQLAISEMEAGDYESAMSHYEEALRWRTVRRRW
ncbi:MAG: tetratricopeptide repeat protein [Clostridium fessum]